MLVFAVRWAPFGGGDAYDIYANFGVDELSFFARVVDLLNATPPPAGIDELARQRLLNVAQQRLSTSRPDPHHPQDELPA